MNSIFNKLICCSSIVMTAFVASALAQDVTVTPPSREAIRPQNSERSPDLRMDVLQQLGLTQDQIRQIRKTNMERRPLLIEAQAKVREANRSLDDAIYSDTVDEQLVKNRLHQAQLAQSEVIKLRFMNEFAIRQILTPEQLARFRELRQRFSGNREDSQVRRKKNFVKRQLKRQTRPI